VLSYSVAGNLKAEELKCEERITTASIPNGQGDALTRVNY
jgi:hypothetical protein